MLKLTLSFQKLLIHVVHQTSLDMQFKDFISVFRNEFDGLNIKFNVLVPLFLFLCRFDLIRLIHDVTLLITTFSHSLPHPDVKVLNLAIPDVI